MLHHKRKIFLINELKYCQHLYLSYFLSFVLLISDYKYDKRQNNELHPRSPWKLRRNKKNITRVQHTYFSKGGAAAPAALPLDPPLYQLASYLVQRHLYSSVLAWKLIQIRFENRLVSSVSVDFSCQYHQDSQRRRMIVAQDNPIWNQLTLSSRLPEDSKQKNLLPCIHCHLGMEIAKFHFTV